MAQDEVIPVPGFQVVKDYKEALTGFSHIHCVGVLNCTSLSQGRVLGAASGRGEGKLHFRIPWAGEGGKHTACVQPAVSSL